uniref:EGF-like domain-containing protein n=1 Tax=Daphnia galeata TaxID=27404 RepID=A0A8J2RLY3_9CRUS|nr:unnamed protein product [Daphnia galeata]
MARCVDPSPCLNGGTCHQSNGEILCLCPAGFSGPRWADNVNDCLDPSVCLNGGICIDGINNFTCTYYGYQGERCETKINHCLLDPCQNGGTCFDRYGGFVWQCVCGFSGNECQFEMSSRMLGDDPSVLSATVMESCAPESCQNGGICSSNMESGIKCLCLPGFSGSRCQKGSQRLSQRKPARPIRNASTHQGPCLKNGTCLNQLNAFQCQCPNGFLGESRRLFTGFVPDNGTCVDQVANYTCVCPAEFMGRHCEQEFDACASLPCKNGASCITTRPQSNFYCECLPGFEGMYCENNIDECFSVQCVDGKQCFDLINGYECRCPVGFTGSYQCYCRPGFSGDNCNLEFDECLSHPCQNNGTCNNLINGYECVCSPGFTGKDCDININECESNPCKNNGACVDGNAVYSCICLAGFTGLRCEINIDECESSPCLYYGLCLDGIN